MSAKNSNIIKSAKNAKNAKVLRRRQDTEQLNIYVISTEGRDLLQLLPAVVRPPKTNVGKILKRELRD